MSSMWRDFAGGPPMDESVHLAFANEVDQTNQSRLRSALPVMVLVHVLHVAAFWTTPSTAATLETHVLAFKDALVWTHGLTGLVVALLAVGAWQLPSSAMRWFAPLTGTVYLLHAAVIAGVDQLNVPTVGPFMAYALAVVVVMILEPGRALAMYAVGLLAYFAALTLMQPDPQLWLSLLPRGPSATVGGLILVSILFRTRRRDHSQRHTIDLQRQQLEALNTKLAQRVDEQVEEITARAADAERLNTQLRAQVHARTRQLSAALDQIGGERDDLQTSLSGRIADERFEFGDMIGRGGMGEVYEGIDRLTDAPIALKVIRTARSTPPDTLRRFLREAEAVSSLGHPAIARMLHVDATPEGMLYQVQELVQGEPLHLVLRRHKQLPAHLVARLLGTLAQALAVAHSQQILHRDVKPANIMLVGVHPGLKLLDFGIAKVRETLFEESADTEGTAPLTAEGRALGTPGFMAPEQRVGLQMGAGVDVYALGVVGFIALTGNHPRYGMKPKLPEPDSDIAPKLLAMLNRCLEFDPERRPTADAVAEHMHGLAETEGAPALQMLVRDVIR